MEAEHLEDYKYLKAKKRVEKIKGFYVHFSVYIVINLFLSGVIIYGILSDENETLGDALTNFGVYSTWLFWGIGVLFHWMGVFGFNSFLGKDWEERKLKELIKKEEEFDKKENYGTRKR